MNKYIGENLDGKYLLVHAHEFNEAIEFARKNKIGQIQIRGVIGIENINSVSDFKEIEKLSPYLKVISFAGLLDNKIVNFENIYSLINLKKIYIQCKQNFSLDVSRFNLIHLGLEYWKGINNIGGIKSLESIVIRKYPNENIKELSTLANLKILHIYSSKIKTLEGIEKLNKLKVLCLAHNNNLENIESIKENKLLNNLSIEKCNKINDYNFIIDMVNIKKLEIDKLKKSRNIIKIN
jgi:hypothetical protein